MLRPSYNDLMNSVNSNTDDGEHPVINSRYGIVIATAKRARQIIAGADILADDCEGKKPLSIAIDEIYTNKVNILPETEDIEEEAAITDGIMEEAIENYSDESEEEAEENLDISKEKSEE